ncbi:MAG: hypothetical protein WC149_13475 [Arcobacteraceae bacterium]
MTVQNQTDWTQKTLQNNEGMIRSAARHNVPSAFQYVFDTEIAKGKNQSQALFAANFYAAIGCFDSFDEKLLEVENRDENSKNPFWIAIASRNNKQSESTMERLYQESIRTNENAYEDAPKFEAFVKEEMAKGQTEQQAIRRANMYAVSGLLDYGKQRVVDLCCYLPFEDQKNHGLHLFNNPLLTQTVKDAFDQLDTSTLSIVVDKLFIQPTISEPIYDYSDMSQENIDKIFNNILSHFGLRPEDVEILEDTTSSNDMGKLTLEFLTLQQEQFKTIIKSVQKAMQKHIDFFEEDLKNNPQEFKKIQEAFKSIALKINSLIDNLNEKTSTLFQLTQNRKPNPLNAM